MLKVDNFNNYLYYILSLKLLHLYNYENLFRSNKWILTFRKSTKSYKTPQMIYKLYYNQYYHHRNH